MKNIFLTIACIASLISVGKCQNINQTTNTDSAKVEAPHPMLHPDANTVYLDEAGQKIDLTQFGTLLKTGKYSFIPAVENGRIKSVQLKTKAAAITAGNEAPDFSITDINGNHFALKDLKGKTVVLNFWFTSCAPCIQEMPELNDLRDKYKNDPSVVFLAVTYNSASQVKNFLAKKDFKFNIAADQMAMINQYGVTGYPTSLIIDKSGGVAFALTSYDGTNVQQIEGVLQALKGK